MKSCANSFAKKTNRLNMSATTEFQYSNIQGVKLAKFQKYALYQKAVTKQYRIDLPPVSKLLYGSEHRGGGNKMKPA
jgi:hypothetical protein